MLEFREAKLVCNFYFLWYMYMYMSLSEKEEGKKKFLTPVILLTTECKYSSFMKPIFQ